MVCRALHVGQQPFVVLDVSQAQLRAALLGVVGPQLGLVGPQQRAAALTAWGMAGTAQAEDALLACCWGAAPAVVAGRPLLLLLTRRTGQNSSRMSVQLLSGSLPGMWFGQERAWKATADICSKTCTSSASSTSDP